MKKRRRTRRGKVICDGISGGKEKEEGEKVGEEEKKVWE